MLRQDHSQALPQLHTKFAGLTVTTHIETPPSSIVTGLGFVKMFWFFGILFSYIKFSYFMYVNGHFGTRNPHNKRGAFLAPLGIARGSFDSHPGWRNYVKTTAQAVVDEAFNFVNY